MVRRSGRESSERKLFLRIFFYILAFKSVNVSLILGCFFASLLLSLSLPPSLSLSLTRLSFLPPFFPQSSLQSSLSRIINIQIISRKGDALERRMGGGTAFFPSSSLVRRRADAAGDARVSGE